MISALNNLGVGAVSGVKSTSTATPSATLGTASGGTQAAVTRISPQAELLGKLSALKEADPKQFEATLNQMASDVREKAKTASGTEAAHMNDFADKLTAAAKSGDLSALQADAQAGGGKPAGGRPAGGPHGPPPGGGGPPRGGAGGGASKSSSKGASDPADTNGDGTVSAAEKAVYALTHSSSSSSTSDASGAAST